MKDLASSLLLGLLIAFTGCEDGRVGGDEDPCPGGQRQICDPGGCTCVPANDGDGGGEPANCRAAGEGELVVNEVMIDPEGDENAGEFVELVNGTGDPLLLRDLTLFRAGLAQSESALVTFTSGCLPPRGAVAVFTNSTPDAWMWEPLPAPLPAISGTGKSFRLGNSADFQIELRREDGTVVSVLSGPHTLIRQGESVNRSPDDLTGGEAALHSEVSPNGLKKSPSRCVNGGTFAADCADAVRVGDVGPIDHDAVPDGGPDASKRDGPPDAVPMDAGPPCPARAPARKEVFINEVLINATGRSEHGKEFVELVNATGDVLALDDLTLDYDSHGGDGPKVIVTFGRACMSPHAAVAVYETTTESWIWSEPPEGPVQAHVEGFTFTNSRAFTFHLLLAGEEISVADGLAGLNDADGVSANRNPDGAPDGPFVKHTELAPDTSSSPAACANGGAFSEGCQAP